MRTVVYDSVTKNEMFSIPGDRIVSGNLGLHHHPVGSGLAHLPPFRVTGNVIINDTQVTALPDGMAIDGILNAMGCRQLRDLPDRLFVGGTADFKDSGLRHIGHQVVIDGDLFLEGTAVTSLPDDLRVGGMVVIPDGRKMPVSEAREELARLHRVPTIRFMSPDEQSWVDVKLVPSITRQLSKASHAIDGVGGTWLEMNPDLVDAHWHAGGHETSSLNIDGMDGVPAQFVVHADGRVALQSKEDPKHPGLPRTRSASVKLDDLVPVLKHRDDAIVSTSGVTPVRFDDVPVPRTDERMIGKNGSLGLDGPG